jgi:hypothetical protein
MRGRRAQIRNILPATVAILPICLRNRHPIAARAIVM